MTSQGAQATKEWQDRAFAEGWVASDQFEGLLGLPRRIAAALVSSDRPGSTLVLDVASGPGAFLTAMLEELPAARGIWSDASAAMADEAKKRLSGFAERVEFKEADMTDLPAAGLPSGIDAIVTSRAAHHLDRVELGRFYTQCAELLAPGGWLVNLDHIGPSELWDRRLRAVRPRFVPASAEGPKHHHNYPLTSVSDHIAAYLEAGIDDVEVVWRGFYTCLFMGRKSD